MIFDRISLFIFLLMLLLLLLLPLLFLLINFIWWGPRLENSMLKNHAEETKIKTLVYSNTLLSKCWQIYIYLYDDMYINTYEKMHTLPHFTTRKRLKQNRNHTRIKVPSPSKWHPIYSIWNTHFNNHFHILYLFFSPTHLFYICAQHCASAVTMSAESGILTIPSHF